MAVVSLKELWLIIYTTTIPSRIVVVSPPDWLTNSSSAFTVPSKVYRSFVDSGCCCVASQPELVVQTV